MDKKFIESLKGLPESELVKRLLAEGYKGCSVPFMMADNEVTRAVLPKGSQRHKEVLFLDYNIIRPKQYNPHECYAIFVKD